jgi:hypothetical protein
MVIEFSSCDNCGKPILNKMGLWIHVGSRLVHCSPNLISKSAEPKK